MRRGGIAEFQDGRDGETGRATWALPGPVLLYLACFLGIAWPWLLGYVTIPWDAKAHFLPQVQFLADSLRRGDWPWWNPYVFSGQPQVADPQSMLFSPPALVLALFTGAPGPHAFDVMVLATVWLGGLGLMLWFRDRGWHWAGAGIAALAFTFGAAMGWRIQHTGQVFSMAYWPWALWLTERAVRRGSLGAGLGAGLFGAAIVLGRDQVALLGLYLLAGRVAWLWLEASEPGQAMRRSVLPLGGGALVAAALIAVPVLMTVLLAANSNRPVIDFEGAGRGSLHPALLVTLVLPQLFGAAGHMAEYWGPPSFAWNTTGLYIAQNMGLLYVGAVPLLLVTLALLTGRLWAREVRFFTIALLLTGLYALGWYTPVFRAFYELVPGVNLYRRPADAVFEVGALLAILAGYAAHRVFSAPWERPPRGVLLVLLAGLTAAGGFAVLLGVQIDRSALVPMPLLGGAICFGAAALAIAWAWPRVALSPVAASVALAAVTAGDLWLNNGPTSSSALPMSFYDVLDPATRNETIAALKELTVRDGTRRDRVELAGLGFHWPNASMTHRLENTLGYNPVRLGLYSRATGAEDHVGLPDQRKFSALMPSYASPLADMLGLRWIAAGAPVETFDKTLPEGTLRLVRQTEDGLIYENPRALPRVLFAIDAQQVDFEAILKTGAWPPFDPRRTVLLQVWPGLPTQWRPGVARILAYGTTRIEIDAESLDGGFVVLNDVWHPWWRAEVDGKPVAIERANVLFRAVAVGPGRHRVVFEFRPLAGLIEQIRERGTAPD